MTLRVDGVTRASAPALIRATARCIDDNDAAIRALHRKHGGDIRPDRAHRSGDVVVWYPVADGAGAIPTDELLAHVDAFGEVIRAFTDGAAVRQPDHEV